MQSRIQPFASSTRILFAYVEGLQAEVARLIQVREHSQDMLWMAQLDLQIKLKLQLIDDMSVCLDEEDPEMVSAREYDGFLKPPTSMPSNS
jgi:hypothetical protein